MLHASRRTTVLADFNNLQNDGYWALLCHCFILLISRGNGIQHPTLPVDCQIAYPLPSLSLQHDIRILFHIIAVPNVPITLSSIVPSEPLLPLQFTQSCGVTEYLGRSSYLFRSWRKPRTFCSSRLVLFTRSLPPSPSSLPPHITHPGSLAHTSCQHNGLCLYIPSLYSPSTYSNTACPLPLSDARCPHLIPSVNTYCPHSAHV